MKEEVDRSRRSMLWIAPLGGIALKWLRRDSRHRLSLPGSNRFRKGRI